VLGLHTFDQTALHQLEKEIEQIDLREQLYQGFRDDRSIVVYRKRNIFKYGWFLPNGYALPTVFAHGWILADLAKSIEYHNQILGELKTRPINNQSIHTIEEELKELSDYPLTRATVPSSLRTIGLTERTEGTLRSARTALAAERYRLDKGEFPVTLDELVPEYMEEIPKDPFDGKPLRYKKKDDRVIFYSIGEDRSDDGGDVEDKTYPVPEDFKPTDWGFVLLKPEYRNQPPVETRPASRPATRSRPAE
jgi:hypothetical protein